MNNIQEHQENHSYLLWPIAVLLFLTIAVFLATTESFQPTVKIRELDGPLSIILLLLFAVSLVAGVLAFLQKKGN